MSAEYLFLYQTYAQYRFYVLSLFELVFNFQKKKKIYKYKWCSNCFETIFRYVIPSKMLFLIIFVMGDFKRDITQKHQTNDSV